MYEHQTEVNHVSKNIMDVLRLLTDDVPDQQQIAALLAEATTIFAQVTAALSAEAKEAYKAKFIAKVGLSVAGRSLDLYLPDSES